MVTRNIKPDYFTAHGMTLHMDGAIWDFARLINIPMTQKRYK